MGNFETDYQAARSLRLGPYERYLVERIVHLLMKHDARVEAEKRRRNGQRISAAMRARQDAGFRVSSIPPYGSAVDPSRPWRLVPQPDEQRVRDTILRSHADGSGYRAIARELNSAGIPCRSGGLWSHQTVRAIVRRAAQSGNEV